MQLLLKLLFDVELFIFCVKWIQTVCSLHFCDELPLELTKISVLIYCIVDYWTADAVLTS